jgi:hypothetical protein
VFALQKDIKFSFVRKTILTTDGEWIH